METGQEHNGEYRGFPHAVHRQDGNGSYLTRTVSKSRFATSLEQFLDR